MLYHRNQSYLFWLAAILSRIPFLWLSFMLLLLFNVTIWSLLNFLLDKTTVRKTQFSEIFKATSLCGFYFIHVGKGPKCMSVAVVNNICPGTVQIVAFDASGMYEQQGLPDKKRFFDHVFNQRTIWWTKGCLSTVPQWDQMVVLGTSPYDPPWADLAWGLGT